MKKLKNKEHLEAKIKITKIRECFKPSNGVYNFKDKLFFIKIDKPAVSISTSFECNEDGKKKLLEFIKKELYL